MENSLFLACPAANPSSFSWQNAGGTIEVSGRQVTTADFSGAPTDDVATRIVAAYRRSRAIGGTAGAIELPHPHQQTIYPGAVVARAEKGASKADLMLAAEEAVSTNWQVSVPKGPGFRRNLALPGANRPAEDDPKGIFDDYYGRMRHFGRNAPHEYQYVAQDVPDWPHDLMSIRLRFAGKEPTSQDEAVRFGEQLDQVMTSIANLSLLWNAAKQADDSQSPYGLVFLVLTNINALVESTVGLCEGKKNRKVEKLLKKCHANAAHPWGASILATALRGWFPTTAPFASAIANLADEVTAVVEYWERFRNGWAHQPPPLNASLIECGSRQRVLSIDEAKRVAASSYAVAYSICEAAGSPPLPALESVNALPSPPDPDVPPKTNVAIIEGLTRFL